MIIKRRDFLGSVAGAGVATAASCITAAGGVTAASGAAQAQTARRPNIVFILADDLGWGDLRCYNGSSAIPTPNYDRVAREGVRFTDCHSPSSVCTPTRYGVLTGRYCWRSRLKSGVQGYHRALIDPGRTTVASMRGSRTARTRGGAGRRRTSTTPDTAFRLSRDGRAVSRRAR